ncbi:MAG: CHAD domain-containing protein [Blastocatellia bacterium]
MAKAQPIVQRTGANDPQTWLAEVLRVRFADVLRYREAALDASQIDGVHDMRVAIRRLRSVIRDFVEITDKFPLRSLRKTLKRLAYSLGNVRDIDVFVLALEKMSERAGKDSVRTGIAAIVAEYRDNRQAAHADLVKTLSDEFATDLERRFAAAIEISLRQRGLFQVSNVQEAGGKVISKCLKDFLNLSESIYFPSATERLHRLRIAGKHLRYAIELFSEAFGDEIGTFAEETRGMQSHLGEVHDCDVWFAQLRSRLTNGKRKLAIDPAERDAAAWLMSQFVRRRMKAYRSALALWNEWEADGFADRLSNLILRI